MKPGDKVVMQNCYEAKKYAGRVWTVRSEPWDLCGTTVVLLEGKSGGFAVECLRLATAEELEAMERTHDLAKQVQEDALWRGES